MSLVGEHSRRSWRRIAQVYELDDKDQARLSVACEALDRLREAQALLRMDGLVTDDRFGQANAHPCVGIERDSRIGFLRALRELQLRDEGVLELVRPPLIHGRYRSA